jgi:signal transduction histidine kinase
MELRRRSLVVYGLLACVWGLVVAWQTEEHLRVKEGARTELRNRSKEIASTLSAVIRGMRFRGGVSQERLEGALNELVNRSNEVVKSSEVVSISLLNAANDEIAKAGWPIDFGQRKELLQEGERWARQSVTLVNPVDLGASLAVEGITNTFVRPPRSELTNLLSTATNLVAEGLETTNPAVAASLETTNGASRGPREGRSGEFRSRRFPWLRNDKEYQALLEKRGIHGLVIGMSTESLQAAATGDLWLRGIIVLLVTVSVLGYGLAWRNLGKSSELQIRLVRASELNTHLKEMNLAAAGLAHETRNPLNIIRGLAQMISKQEETRAEVRQKSREIIDEADKVAAQLNEFINYSRPREVRRTPLALGAVVGEVVRALNYDIEEKRIRLQVKADAVTVEADEQMLRQALFNLLLNAIQAVDGVGDIQIQAERRGAAEAVLEVRDNGPGVAPEHRSEIFKPYFTTQKTGTGLGLAVVQQIAQAHGWEIECVPNQPRGAVFRITHLRLAV